MSTYYVKTSGNNSSAGTSWSAAWATIAKAMSVASSGDTVYIAPGTYNEYGLTPTNAGAHNAVITYHGDWDQSIVDGSAATHGVGEGLICFDASLGTGNIGHRDSNATNYKNLDPSNNWKYHKFKNIGFFGAACVSFFQGASASITGQFEFEDCIFESYAELISSNTQARAWVLDTANSKTWIGKFTRCHFHGFVSTCWKMCTVKSTDFNSSPDYIFDGCMFIHSDNVVPVFLYGSSSSYYTYASFKNCTHIGYAASFINGSNATYCKVDVARCLFVNPHLTSRPITTGVTEGTISENYWMCAESVSATYSGWTKIQYNPLLLPFPYLRPSHGNYTNPLVDASTYNTAGTDIHGVTTPVGTYRDIGAQEYNNKSPRPPVINFPAAAAAAGGSGPTIGGRLVR